MKTKSILIAFFVICSSVVFAIDFSNYTSVLEKNISLFKQGITTEEGFKQIVVSLNDLRVKLEAETSAANEISKKEELLEDIQAVYSFVGEISPDMKSFGLMNSHKERAKTLLEVTEEKITDVTFCMPLSKVTLWGGTYVCYLLQNNTNNMVTYKYNYIVQGKFSATTGSVEAGVSKNCSRAIYQSFKNLPVSFKQEKCEGYQEKIQEPVVVAPPPTPIVQPEQNTETVVEPKKVLTKEQKAALKKKEAAERKKLQAKKKREAEKLKAQKKREKEKLKREREKEKAAEKRERANK
jgi:hypothetical protein